MNQPKKRNKRPCSKCGKVFQPSGPTTKMCDDCKEKMYRSRRKIKHVE